MSSDLFEIKMKKNGQGKDQFNTRFKESWNISDKNFNEVSVFNGNKEKNKEKQNQNKLENCATIAKADGIFDGKAHRKRKQEKKYGDHFYIHRALGRLDQRNKNFLDGDKQILRKRKHLQIQKIFQTSNRKTNFS